MSDDVGDGGRAFRTKQSERSRDNRDWTLEDMLRDALEAVKAGEVAQEGEEVVGAYLVILARDEDSDRVESWSQGLTRETTVWVLGRRVARILLGQV